MNKPKIAVLLAAYNGVNWLEEQLQSILVQRDVNVTIYISVDLSTDNTLQWCHDFAKNNKHVVVLEPSERFGCAARNFYYLIREVDFSVYDYVAFADQDDIWLDDKLSAACTRIEKGQYSAYSSNAQAFWPNGREVLIDKAQPQRAFDYLFEAAGPGCTYVLTVSSAMTLKKFMLQHWATVNDATCHDWLIYAWFRVQGLSWHIDAEPKLRYRQHGSNEVGANKGFTAIYNRLKKIRSGWYRTEVNKVARVTALGVDKKNVAFLTDGRVSRWFILRNAAYIRRRFRDRVVLVLLVLLGLY